MIFSAASALPSDLRMMRMISSSASKTFSKPSRMWMRLLQRLELVLEPLGDDLEAEVQEVPEDRLAGRSRSGRPTSGFSVGIRQVRLTMKLVWSGVFLNRYAITMRGSASFFSSSAMRTSSVDTSLTSSSGGSLRDSTTSAMRSTSAALFTA